MSTTEPAPDLPTETPDCGVEQESGDAEPLPHPTDPQPADEA